jgi:hypothetical protein
MPQEDARLINDASFFSSLSLFRRFVVNTSLSVRNAGKSLLNADGVKKIPINMKNKADFIATIKNFIIIPFY